MPTKGAHSTTVETHTDQREVTYDRAGELFTRAVEDNELCPWCFAHQRRYLPGESARHAHALYYNTNGKSTKDTMTSYGHGHDFEGNLDVNLTAISEVDPQMHHDVVPSTFIDGEYHPPKAQSVCVCGKVDYAPNESRSLSELHDCVDHLFEWYRSLGLTTYPPADSFDIEAAHDITTRLRQYDRLSGQDQIVLTEALRSALS